MEAGRDDRELGRIIALLVSLAELAERTAGCCLAVRFVVLLVLRRAEEHARDYAAQATGSDGLWFDDGLGFGCGPAEAELIALRFHDLAAFLAGDIEPGDVTGLAAVLERLCAVPPLLPGAIVPLGFVEAIEARATAALRRFTAACGQVRAAPAGPAVRFHDTS